jgi:hypothetical protein
VSTPRPLPLPPAVAPRSLPSLATEAVGEVWRLHREPDPRHPRAHAEGRFRFDAPAGEFPVTYANADRYGCFAEVYGDRQSIPSRDAARMLSRLIPTQPLKLIPLDDGQLLKALHPHRDGRISTSLEYPTTMQWSGALHTWYPDAHGIRYTARHATPHDNYCLFLDRCADLLQLDTDGKLADLRDTVTRACDAYGLAARLHEPHDNGGW